MVRKKTALSLAIGSAFATSMALAPVASAADNPFEMDSLKDGYQIVADKKVEAKCGEGKCGGDDKGGHVNDENAAEGKCGEGKCGEGKCGGDDKGGHEHDAGEGEEA